MTTEEDFQAQLDETPDAHHVRLVFADWLQERDDPRAEGYRALGMLERRPSRYPFPDGGNWFWIHGERAKEVQEPYALCVLPVDWFAALPTERLHQPSSTEWPSTSVNFRHDVEDAAALAFAKLPTERRHALLNPELVPA